MRNNSPGLWFIVAVVAGLVSPAWADGSSPPATTASSPEGSRVVSGPVLPPTEEQIRQAIRDLNHPSPNKRRAAVGQLSEWGPLAFDALSKVAAGAELEPALLARDLLEQMGEVLFVGGRVRLEADRTRIRWDEPVTITVRVDNPTPGRVVVPWPADNATASQAAPVTMAAQPAGGDARQVAAMMDIADQLTVVGPDGREVELRVDPIEQDTAVHQAVMTRAGEHPPSHVIPAGAGERLSIREFNRGWSRYPMLTAGKYTVRFAYQPRWKDPTWVAQGFGRIESNAATIEVTEAAPLEVQQADRPILLSLRREGGKLIGEVQNTWDRHTWLNLNLNGPLETHARLDWLAQSRSADAAEPFSLDSDATAPQFAADRIVQLAPGAKVVVARADTAAVRNRIRSSGGNETEIPAVRLRYTHISRVQDLRRALREKGRRENIPGPLYNGSGVSEPITLPADTGR